MRYGHLLAAIIFLVILLAAGSFLAGRSGGRERIGLTVPPGQYGLQAETSGLRATPGQAMGGYYTEPLGSLAATIVFTEQGFVPALLTVERGTTVTFVNRTANSFWPASDPHPTHGGYPETASCGGSAFDACAPVPPGAAWTLKLDRIGNWAYHNHLNPGARGTIVVK